MAQLGIQLAGMTWRDFWLAHAPALRLALLATGVSFALRAGLDRADLSDLLILAGTGTVTVGIGLLAAWRFPKLFLGRDGMWMIENLRDFFRDRDGRVAPD